MAKASGDEGASGRERLLSGPLAWVEKALLLIIVITPFLYIVGIHHYLRIQLFSEQFLALWLGCALASVYLRYQPTKGTHATSPPWYDLALAAISLALGILIFILYPQIELSAAFIRKWWLIALSPVALAMVFEASRRTNGWIFIILVAVFVLYTKFTYVLPAPFQSRGLDWERVAMSMWLQGEGLYGMVLRILTTVIIGFIVLGAFFRAIGASEAFTGLAQSTFGKYRGGPAKISVVGSALFGTISGSAVANVVTTGVMTIPLMKKTGYKPHVAGAIEACASTGGQIMPPVMGAAAFLMAEFMQVPYAEVAIAAFIPALLYYVVIFFQVDLEAGKGGLKGITEPYPLLPVLKQSWLLFLVAGVLVYTLLFLYWEPGLSCLAALIASVVFSQFRKSTRLTLRRFVNLLIDGGRGILEMVPMMGMASFIVALLQVSGLSAVLGNLLLLAGEGNIALMLALTAVIAIVLGMGMATSAVYIILAIVVAPALIKAGVQPMAAHMFLFYYGVMSMVTPPVCMASYAGAAIAGASMMKTGFTATRMGITAYIIPWIFVYTPAILLGQGGSVIDLFIVLIKTTAGMFLLSIGLNGYFFRIIGWGRRLLLILAAIGVMIPEGTGIQVSMWLLTAGGTVIGFVILLYEWLARRTERRATA